MRRAASILGQYVDDPEEMARELIEDSEVNSKLEELSSLTGKDKVDLFLSFLDRALKLVVSGEEEGPVLRQSAGAHGSAPPASEDLLHFIKQVMLVLMFMEVKRLRGEGKP